LLVNDLFVLIACILVLNCSLYVCMRLRVDSTTNAPQRWRKDTKKS